MVCPFSKWSIKDTIIFLLKCGCSCTGVNIPLNSFSRNLTISAKLESLLY